MPFLNLATSESKLEVDKESTVKNLRVNKLKQVNSCNLIYNQLIKKLLVSTITLFSNPDLIFYHLNNIAYLFLIFYCYEILDNLMFPHI